MLVARLIDEALTVIGKARMGKIPCNDALDILWELLVNASFELGMAGVDDGARLTPLMN